MAPTDTPTRWAIPEGRPPFAEVDLGPDRVALLRDGFQAYPAMLEAIRGARSTICLETYILRDDTMGSRFIDALCERASAGVETLIMFDDWGSSVSDESLAKLKDAGALVVRVVPFRPFRFTGRLSRFIAHATRRNHRKALIVDGCVGFTGGLNISDEYAAVEDGGHGWRDTHVRVVGPTALELEAMFLRTFLSQRGVRYYDAAKFRRNPRAASTRLKVVGNEFAANRKDIRVAYTKAIQQAQASVFITNAYFMPPARLLRSLLQAARRGVRVAIIFGANTDVKLVLYGTRGLYPRLLKAGVEVYEWKKRVLHAKTAVVDGHWATVGSSNLDALSLRQNLEINAVIEDRTFAGAVERLFFSDVAQCDRVTLDTVRGYSALDRLFSWVAYRLRRWL